MNITVLRRSALVVIFSVTTLIASVSPATASGGAGMHIFVTMSQYSPAPRTLTLDVEGSDSIENVKQKVEDVTYLHPPQMCLVYDGTFLEEGFGYVLDQYGIEQDAVVDLYTLPISAAWSITPDAPFLGGTVSNAVITHPGVTHAEVVNGALPRGVTLNENTGQVDGTFTEPGAFDVTIAVDTLCGNADIAWSGEVPGTLANTGQNDSASVAVAAFGSLVLAGGITLLVARRRVTRAD